MQRGAGYMVAMLVICALPGAVRAGQLCSGAMFHCKTLAETTTGEKLVVDRGMNLRQLIDEEARSLRWVKRNCSLIDRDPFDCDWQRNLKQRAITNRLPAPSPSMNAARVPTRVKRAAVPRVAQRAAARPPTVNPAPIRAPVAAAKKRPFGQHVLAAATRYKLPPDFIAAVMTVESGGNSRAVSHVGAQGLMQLMPVTARAMGVVDPWDPAQNIMGGARFLRVLANRFNGDLVKVLSAYHAGATRVKKRKGTPFSATDRYVRKVLRVYYALRDG